MHSTSLSFPLSLSLSLSLPPLSVCASLSLPHLCVCVCVSLSQNPSLIQQWFVCSVTFSEKYKSIRVRVPTHE